MATSKQTGFGPAYDPLRGAPPNIANTLRAMPASMAYAILIGEVGSRFGDLLGVKYLPDTTAQTGPIGRLLERAFLALNRRDVLATQVELERIRSFAADLETIRDADPATFTRLRTRLLQETDSDFHGVRQEALVAAWLARAEVAYLHERPGKPDFVLVKNETVGVECTSSRFHKGVSPPDDPSSKLVAALSAKGAKPYASPSVAIALLATDLFRHGGMQRHDPNPPARAALAETPYGAVLLFAEIAWLDQGRFAIQYTRNDAAGIAPDLKALLDQAWPKGQLQERGRWAIPATP